MRKISQNGFIALTTVIIIAAFIVVTGLSIALLNADEVLSSYVSLEGARTQRSSEACTNNILGRLKNNKSLSGNVNISKNLNCNGVVSGSGNIKTIEAYATTTDGFGRTTVSKTKVNVNINTNPFTIEEYKDILD